MSAVYTTTVINKGGRDGYSIVGEGQPKFDVVNVLDGKAQPEGTTNPEQLMAAAVASCYNGAFLYFMEEAGQKADVTVKVTLALVPDATDGENKLACEIEVEAPELKAEDLAKFKQQAAEFSPYTKIFAGKADLTIK